MRQWGFLLAAFACIFLLVDFFASNKMPGRKMSVNICQYVFASVLFCQYIFASGFFCQQNLLVYFASNFLPAMYGQQFLPTTFASGYFYSFLLNRRSNSCNSSHVELVRTCVESPNIVISSPIQTVLSANFTAYSILLNKRHFETKRRAH